MFQLLSNCLRLNVRSDLCGVLQELRKSGKRKQARLKSSASAVALAMPRTGSQGGIREQKEGKVCARCRFDH